MIRCVLCGREREAPEALRGHDVCSTCAPKPTVGLVYGRIDYNDPLPPRAPLRQVAKPFRFHRRGCPFWKTATCLCGQEPNYSPAAREARGEKP